MLMPQENLGWAEIKDLLDVDAAGESGTEKMESER